jgi:hypothetical protein
MKISTFLVSVALVAFTGSSIAQHTVSNINVQTVEGKTFDLYTELGKGRTVLLDFWWIECFNCVIWSEDVDQLYLDYNNNAEELFVLGLNIKENGDPTNHNTGIDNFKMSKGFTYPDAGFENNSGGGSSIIRAYYWSDINPIIQSNGFAQTVVIFPDMNNAADSEVKWFKYGALQNPSGQNYQEIKDMLISEGSRQTWEAASATGIEEDSRLKSIMVFPNPAENYINVVTPDLSEDFIVEIHDMTGRLVKSSNIINSGTNVISTSDLNTGIYSLSIITNN